VYLAPLRLEGDPWLLYGRVEGEALRDLAGFRHELRAGAELRREWNAGPGYQFEIEFPPQSRFNGVQGFDRPRRFDAVPALATSALYLDARSSRALGTDALVNLQAGVRLDVLHDGDTWASGARDAVLQ